MHSYWLYIAILIIFFFLEYTATFESVFTIFSSSVFDEGDMFLLLIMMIEKSVINSYIF